MQQFRFVHSGIFATTQVIDQWHGHRSHMMITDDFGNGIEVCNLPVRQWAYSLA